MCIGLVDPEQPSGGMMNMKIAQDLEDLALDKLVKVSHYKLSSFMLISSQSSSDK